MRVKMRKSGAGPNGAFGVGDIVGYFSDAACAQLIKSRQAEAVEDEPKPEPVKEVISQVKAEPLVETATVAAPEDAEWPSKRRKKKE